MGEPAVPFTYETDPQILRETVDVLILPEANLVNPHINYKAQADFIAAVDRPCLLLGVGAQASDSLRPDDFPEIPQGTVDFLKEVSMRTPNIFVRGRFTKAVIARMGIANTKVAGCPSYFINPNRSLWLNIAAKYERSDPLERVSVTEGTYPDESRNAYIDRVDLVFLHWQCLYSFETIFILIYCNSL